MDITIGLLIGIPIALVIIGIAAMYSAALSTVAGKMTKPPYDPTLKELDKLQEELRGLKEEAEMLQAKADAVLQK